jgi:hypothetical protein
VLAIANISNHSRLHRDICVENGCIEILISTLKTFSPSTSLKGNIMQVFSFIVNHKPLPAWDKVKKILRIFVEIITERRYAFAISYATLGLSTMAEIHAEEIIDTGCVSYVIEQLSHNTLSVQAASTLFFSAMTMGNSTSVQAVLSYKSFLPNLSLLLRHATNGIKHGACRILGNLIANEGVEIECIIKNGEFLDPLADIVMNYRANTAIRAIYVIENISRRAGNKLLMDLVNNYTHVIRKAIVSSNVDIRQSGLKVVNNVLLKDMNDREISKIVDETGLVSEVLMVRNRENEPSDDEKTVINSILWHYGDKYVVRMEKSKSKELEGLVNKKGEN